jgi:putative ABC transport system permease protein
MDIYTLQKLTSSPNKINFIEVSALCSGCPIEDIVNQIRSKMGDAEINAVQKMVKQRMSAVNFVEKIALVLSLVIILTACFMIAIFMYASVNERKKEIGILRAIGYSKLNIFSIFTTEALVIGFFSGIIGYVGGYLLSIKLIKTLEITEGVHISFDLLEGVVTVVLVAALAVISSTIPSFKAAKITPSEALISL